MQELLYTLLGFVAAPLVAWVLGQLNKKALASWLAKALSNVIKDPKARNAVENEIGFFFMEAGWSIVMETPENENVRLELLEAKKHMEAAKRAAKEG